MILMDGKLVSKEIQQSFRGRIELLKDGGIIPGIGVILVGKNSESIKYISAKKKACLELGVAFRLISIDNITEEYIIGEINKLNNDPLIHGILVQLPLPKNLDSNLILKRISPDKDVDGFHPINAGNLFLNLEGNFSPCTPLGCIELLKYYNIDVKGMNIVIVGCSNIVGMPLSTILVREHATVTLCHIHTKEIKKHTRMADLIISCCGVPHLIKEDWIKEDVIMIDVGINTLNGKLVGDVDFNSVKDKCSYITPVPGGVGPMTITMLIKQLIESAERINI